jgi:hypothetical protein
MVRLFVFVKGVDLIKRRTAVGPERGTQGLDANETPSQLCAQGRTSRSYTINMKEIIF